MKKQHWEHVFNHFKEQIVKGWAPCVWSWELENVRVEDLYVQHLDWSSHVETEGSWYVMSLDFYILHAFVTEDEANKVLEYIKHTEHLF